MVDFIELIKTGLEWFALIIFFCIPIGGISLLLHFVFIKLYIWYKIDKKYINSDDPKVREDLEYLFRAKEMVERYEKARYDLFDPDGWITVTFKDIIDFDKIVYTKPEYVSHINRFVIFLFKITGISYVCFALMAIFAILALFYKFLLLVF